MKLLGLLVILLFIVGCKIDTGWIIVGDGETLPQDICDNIKDRVIVVHRTGCPACAMALPLLRQIEEENNLEFEYYDTLIPKERTKLLNLGFVTKHTPGLVFECKVYEGALFKENYEKILNVN